MIDILDTVKQIPCNPKNYGGSRRPDWIKFLVFHYTGNDGDSDANNALYYRDNVVKSSAHYFVDDDSITQSVGDLSVAWAVGGKKWSDIQKTGGGTMFGIVTNNNSISIEMCDTKRDGTLMATEATLERAAALGRALMKKYNIPIENVFRHFDVTGKHCPAYFMDLKEWNNFKKRLVEEESEMKLYHWIADMPEWAKKSVEKAMQNGYVNMDPKSGAVNIWEVNLQPLVWMDRAGILDKPAIDK